MNKFFFLILLRLLLLTLIPSSLLGGSKLSHEVFLKELENSNNQIYNKCLRIYDEYLTKHPNDINVQIEKCKFIQLAQYDDDEYYNPNQETFDSCASVLTKKYPTNPDVLIFQTTYLYEDELAEVFKKAEEAVNKNPEEWSNKSTSTLFLTMANRYYYDSKYDLAYSYIHRAIFYEEQYRASFEYARILYKKGSEQEALKALLENNDSTKSAWELNQKADLLLKLKAYPKALEIYNLIDEIDSTYNNNVELANTLEGIGEHDLSRKYLVADTSKNWDKSGAIRKLLEHDFKYQNGDSCIKTYHKYRDLGYSADPLGIYRIKLLFSHPFQALNFRDILGLLTLLLAFLIFLLIPSVWILPVYFIGHNWKLINQEKIKKTLWGLKSFWIISSGYLLASFVALLVDPDYLYSSLNSSFDTVEQTEDLQGKTMLIFVIISMMFGFGILFKSNFKILLSKNWSIKKSVLLAGILLIAYKIIAGIYIKIGFTGFDISVDDLTFITDIFLSIRPDIDSFINYYGIGTSFIFLGLIAPVYEEIMFRGVVLDSCSRYLNFTSANIIQASLFAIIHPSLFLFPAYFLFAIITGILRKKSGGLLSGIVFHAGNNILAILLMS